MHRISFLFLLATILVVRFPATGQSDDETPEELTEIQLARRIQVELSGGNQDAAEKLFASALKLHPDSFALQSMHMTFYSNYYRARMYNEGLRHLATLIEGDLTRIQANPAVGSRLATASTSKAFLLRRQKQPAEALASLNAAITAIQVARATKDNSSLQRAHTSLVSQKATAIVGDEPEEALKLINDEVEEAAATFETKRTDLIQFQRLANVRNMQLRVTSIAAPLKVGQVIDEYTALVSDRLKQSPDNLQSISIFTNAYQSAVGYTYKADPERAEELVAAAVATLESLDMENARIKKAVATGKSGLFRYSRSIASAKKRKALIGTPAIPIDADAWVNGDPLTDEDLAGKVVLLDFWAVWCGPCIATFPHLTQWTEKYSDKGLVVVGATRYYKDDWDDEAKKRVRKKELSNEDERAATVKFAAHHGLKHRLFYVSKTSKLNAHYAVTSIPTAVLIDRSGKVRFMKVGAGSASAHQLEQKIEELLAENAE